MTVARASQIVAEVVRRNDAVSVKASQIVVEVLRARPGIIVFASQVAVEVLRPNADLASPSGHRPRIFVIT